MKLVYEFGPDDEDFEFEVDNKDLEKALKEIIAEYVCANKDSDDTRRFLDFILNDIYTSHVEKELLKLFEEELKEAFENEAMEAYEQQKDLGEEL